MATSKYAINGVHIECSSCLNVFVDPRILPCGHTFCLQCIKGQINANNASSFTCALCRQAWTAPDGLVDNLPKNYSLAAVTSEAQREEEKLVSDSLRDLTVDVNPKFLCSRHPGQTFTVYCKTCKLLACDSCQMTMHRGHACVATDVADAEFKTVIRSVSDECSTNIDMHKQFVDKYEAKLMQAKADLQLRQRQFEQYKMLLNDTESSYVERAAAVDIVAANQQPTMSQRMTRRWGHDIGPVEPRAGPPHSWQPPLGPPYTGPPHAGPPHAGPPHLGPPHAWQLPLGPPHASPLHAGPPHLGPPNLGPPNLGPPNLGPPHLGPPNLGPSHAAPPQAWLSSLGPPHLGSPHASSPYLGLPNLGPSHLGPPHAAPPPLGPPHAGPPHASLPNTGPPHAGPPQFRLMQVVQFRSTP